MSGLDKIISRLEDDCAAECERISAEADGRAAQTIADARAEAERRAAGIIAEAEKDVELITKKAASAASLNDRRMVLEAKSEIINDTVEAAVKKLRALDTQSYFAVLTHLAKKYRMDGHGVMFLSETDLGRMPADFAPSLGDVEISGKPAAVADGFILKYGEIEINCTFGSMLNAARDDLKALAGELLFG